MLKNEKHNATTQSALLYDRGLHYGDGLFETIAVKSGQAEYLDEHINRLQESCVRLKIHNVAFSDIKMELVNQANLIHKGILKIIITRGVGGRGYSIPDNHIPRSLILQYPWPEFKKEYWTQGVAIKKCTLVLADQPVLAGMKHLNRLENIMAKMELDSTVFQEGLLCDSEQNVIEATSSNVFVVINNKIITPTLEKSGVAGIMREQLIKKVQTSNMELAISRLPYATLLTADEIFLTNSIIGVWPVAKFNERIYHHFPITRKIMTLLDIAYQE